MTSPPLSIPAPENAGPGLPSSTGRGGPVGRLVRLAVAALLLGTVFWLVDPATALAALSGAEGRWVALALACELFGMLVLACRLQLLLGQVTVPVRLGQIVRINLEAQFYTLFLPTNLAGGVIKWHRLSRFGDRVAVFHAVALDKVINLGLLLTLGVLALLVEGSPMDNSGLPLALVLAGGTLLGLGLVLTRSGQGLLKAVVRAGFLFLPTTWVRHSRRLLEPLVSYARLGRARLLAILALSLLSQAAGFLMFWALARALGLPLPLLTVLWVRSLLMLVQILPVSIGGLGVREGSAALALTPYGIPAAAAVAWSLLYFGLTAAFGALGGLLEMGRWVRGGPSPRR